MKLKLLQTQLSLFLFDQDMMLMVENTQAP